ncbi:MAG: hypothetical protein ACI9AR_000142 [Flavobacteriaceae bacterium]|jgi:hypothetical protein
MKKNILAVGVFVLGGIVGALIVSPYSYTPEDMHDNVHMSDGAHMSDGYSHVHGVFDVSMLDSKPSVDIIATSDSVNGFNINISTENFIFAPENAGGVHKEGEGHAHIYVDGVKISRIYGEWYHLTGLEKGEHKIEVRLSTNDHKEIVHGEMTISGSVTVEV